MFYGYVRVSSAGQEDNSSPVDQELQLTAFAQGQGQAIQVFKGDLGVSGSIAFSERGDGKNLLELAVAGDTIVVTKLDRAFRSTKDALNTKEEFDRRGIHLIILQLGYEPVGSSAIGRLVFTVLAAVAEWEREQIVERTGRGRAAKRAAGGILGGKLAPFGYRKEGKGKDAHLIPVAEEQTILREVLAMIDDGLNDYRIARNLQKRGFSHTRTKGAFVHQHIKSMRQFAERSSGFSMQSL